MLALAVVGLGRAGAARVRALRDHPRARLAAIVRSRPGSGEWCFDQLLAAPVDGAVLCTPNTLHADQIAALLSHARHVATEFPVATTAARAGTLFALAEQRARVLHVAHIELETEDHHRLRKQVATRGRPRTGEVRFCGGHDGWVTRDELSGGPAVLASARLHRLVDLFGEATVRDAHCRRDGTGYELTVRLEFANGGCATLVETRRQGAERETRFDLVCEHGRLDQPEVGGSGSLFREDLDRFIDRIESHTVPVVETARELHVLGLIEAIANALVER